MSAYVPKEDISAGPYKISAINPGEAILVKNPYFYDANKISINEIDIRDNSINQQIFNYLIGGQVYLATSGGMSVALVKQIEKTPGNIFFKTPSFVTAALVFNESVHPFDLVAVRQAIAYVIDRKAVQSVAEPTGGTVSIWSDEMNDAQTKGYLTADQQAKLNRYLPDLAKAAQLLESAGFKKVNGQWMMPDGKPFEISLSTVNGFSDWIEAATVMQSELSSFGIPTKPVIVSSYPQYLQELGQGKISVGFWISSLGPNIYNTFARIYGPEDGYNLIGGKLTYYPASKPNGGNWLNFPQTVQVKGYGTVNVGELTNQLNETTDPATVKQIVAKLAFATNQYLPEITLWNYAQAGFVNDRYFTDYPIHDQKIMVATEGYYPSIGIWEILGYVHPR